MPSSNENLKYGKKKEIRKKYATGNIKEIKIPKTHWKDGEGGGGGGEIEGRVRDKILKEVIQAFRTNDQSFKFTFWS